MRSTPSEPGPGSGRSARNSSGIRRTESDPSGAGPHNGGWFRRHLEDAILLNRDRMPRYARLTAGASTRISKRLIRLERVALPFARLVDRRAARYLRHGVPVVRADFVDMAATPPFRERADADPRPPRAFQPPGGWRLAWRLWRAFRRGGFDGLGHALEGALDVTRTHPRYGCMLRHVLESTLRIANLAPLHARRAADAGLAPPTGLSAWMIRSHLLVLPSAVRLDRLAAPIQARGIPILCRDVPPIETDPARIAYPGGTHETAGPGRGVDE